MGSANSSHVCFMFDSFQAVSVFSCAAQCRTLGCTAFSFNRVESTDTMGECHIQMEPCDVTFNTEEGAKYFTIL